MTESSEIWKLHLIYRLSQIQDRLDEDVLGKVRTIEGVTSVGIVPSHDAATHLTFSTRYANAVVASVRGQKVSARCYRRTQRQVVVVAAESDMR